MKVSNGTIVDATIINAPSSTKNASGERDPEMHQTKKGNQWYFGMKDSAYAGQTGMIEALAPAAKDLTQKRGRGYKYLTPRQRIINRARSRVRARVEHAIGVVKRVFGFTKVRYRGTTVVVRPKSANRAARRPIGRQKNAKSRSIAAFQPNPLWSRSFAATYSDIP